MGISIEQPGAVKYLLIGPERNRRHPEQTGGIIVLYENLISWLLKNRISHLSIDSNKANYRNRVFALTCILSRCLWNIPKSDVVILNGTALDYVFIAPFVVFWSRVFGKVIVLRKFAGHFDSVFDAAPLPVRWLMSLALRRASILLWETKRLVGFGARFNVNNSWLPNVRHAPSVGVRAEESGFRRRFCFISHVCSEKGVDDLLAAGHQLSEDYKIDIYGPITDGMDPAALNTDRVRYLGAIRSDQVSAILLDYDCLLLPTRRKAEGYPGIIIEAFGVGVPVIATRIGGIPEIVTDGLDGILFDPGNVQQLVDAIMSLDEWCIRKMRGAALRKFQVFDAERVYSELFGSVLPKLRLAR